MDPLATLEAFDSALARRGLRLDGIVIGGTALNLLGIVKRQTRDCDVLVPPTLDPAVVEAARAFAQERTRNGDPLQDGWLNTGPATVVDYLPDGWGRRLQPAFAGAAIEFQTLSRKDLIFTKVYAYLDRETDLDDLKHLKPSRDELTSLEPWLRHVDANPAWPSYLTRALLLLEERLREPVEERDGGSRLRRR